MSKEKNTKQMSFAEDSHVNPFQWQEKEKEQMTIDTYGMKLLESSENVNQNGLLAKMLKALLTSKKAWYSDRCKLTWKKKVSKSNVLLYQLQASVLGIKEKEFGLSDVMYPTPTVGCEEGGEQSERVEQTKSGGFILRKKNNPNKTFGAKLSDAMLYLEKNKMYLTPSASEHKYRLKGKTQALKCLEAQARKLGGKLNPNFVEFLMGYPINWTKIEPTESKHLETQSYPKSQEKSEKQSLKQKMYRTPTSMDTNEDSMIYAAKILKGKVNRNSNQKVQITLSTDVAMEYLKNNPHLIDQFDKPFMYRPNLPEKLEFINYLRSQTTIKELVNNTDIPETKIAHWFRKDNCFSYPSIEDWNKIKKNFKELKFDEEMTFEINNDWKAS